MKTLVVVNFPPYPPMNGSPLRVWQHINVLATRGPVYVFSAGGEREPTVRDIPGVAEWVHFNDSDFPEPNRLISRIVRVLISRQYLMPNPFAQIKINRALRRCLKQIAPDVIVLSHWKNACPAPLRGHANLVLDMHNIESLLATGVRNVAESKLKRNVVLWRWRRRERDLARTAKRIWVCGPNDIAALKELDPRLPPPLVWPNAIDLKRYEALRNRQVKPPAGLEPRVPTIGYTGFYSYSPNLIAATDLIENIFPLVAEQFPGTRLLLIGDGASSSMKRAAQKDSRIVVTGGVNDVEPYLAAIDVCVVALQSGGGTRLKILECFAAKIPVVSTSKGVEGIAAVPGRHVQVADSSSGLAECAIALIRNPEARQRQVDAAFELVRQHYSWDALAARVDEALTDAVGVR